MRLFRPPAPLAVLAAVALATALAAAGRLHAVEPMPPNPFAGFESFRLANGMTVWYRHAPGATLTSMAVIVPYGRDHDPPGKEQTAHLLEHVLLSDRAGSSEAELVRELTARGGSFAGVTGPHYTLFPVSIESAHAAWGLHWLHGVIAPRIFPHDVVERNREPVTIEMEGHGRPVLRGAAARLLDHPRMRPHGFWMREFGYPAHEERRADEVAALARITPRDLRVFYDSFYAPPAMTLIVIGALPSAALMPVVEETFGTLPWRPVPPPMQATRVRESANSRFVHHTGRSTRYTLMFRLPDVDGRDMLRLGFIEDLLRYRLNERLRRGDVKSVYGVSATSEVRGSAALFAITIEMNPRHEQKVRDAVQSEIARIANATRDTAAFYADRDVLGRALRVEHASPGALRAWAMRRAWRPDLFDAFPDVGEYYATVGPDSVAAFAARALTPERSVTSVARPLPVHAGALLVGALALIVAALALYRRLTLRPADMNTIRFVARLRRPLPVRVLAIATAASVVVVTARIIAAAAHIVTERFILPHDSFLLVALASATFIFTLTFAVVASVGMLRHKVLVFDGEIRLKSPTSHATCIPARRVHAVARAGDGPLPRLRRPSVRTGRGAVVLQLDDGSGYLLHVRDPAALILAVDRLRQRAAVPLATTPAPAVTGSIPPP